MDPWYEWLMHAWHGGDALEQNLVARETRRYASRVLDGAQLLPGMTMVDVGTGDGLLALAAIHAIGPSLQVICTDVSGPLLTHVQHMVHLQGAGQQCGFLECSAEHMPAIADLSVDAVTMRAVLAYVPDRNAAFREFHRILKPGGKLSLAEPVMVDDARVVCALKASLDAAGSEQMDTFLSLMHRWKSAQLPDTPEKMAQCPMTNYSERDLVGHAQSSGFRDIHMELHIDVRPFVVSSWEAFISGTPHPLAPSLKHIMRETFSSSEKSLFEKIIRPILETERLLVDERVAYLTATK